MVGDELVVKPVMESLLEVGRRLHQHHKETSGHEYKIYDTADQFPVRDRWAATLYATHSSHHRAFDDAFLEGLSLSKRAAVLDLGCGDGALAERLATSYPSASVTGVDASPSMVATARRRSRENLRFEIWRAQDLSPELGRFDLVISTAVLHWIPAAEHPQVLRRVRSVLVPGGMFRAQFGGRGQISRARRILAAESRRRGGPPNPWYFPGPAAYRRLLAAAGFDDGDGWVRLLRQRRSLPDEEALIGWLRSQILNAYEPHIDPVDVGGFRAKVEARALRELRRPDGSYDQDYIRLDLLARRRD
jgi:trans-aconitate methyltransferase